MIMKFMQQDQIITKLEKLLLTNLVIYLQFLLLKWQIYSNKRKKILSKLHKSSSSIAFI